MELVDEFTKSVPNASWMDKRRIYVQMALGRLPPKKVMRMFVLPQQLFLDGLQCTLMVLAP